MFRQNWTDRMTPGAMSLSENKNQYLTFSQSFCLFDSKPFCEAVKVGVEDCFFPSISTLREFHSSLFSSWSFFSSQCPSPSHAQKSKTFPRNTQHETYKEKKKDFCFCLKQSLNQQPPFTLVAVSALSVLTTGPPLLFKAFCFSAVLGGPVG